MDADTHCFDVILAGSPLGAAPGCEGQRCGKATPAASTAATSCSGQRHPLLALQVAAPDLKYVEAVPNSLLRPGIDDPKRCAWPARPR
jgi:hypothetical protein